MRRRSAHVGRGASRVEEGLGEPPAFDRRIDCHDFFWMTWHDVMPGNDPRIVLHGFASFSPPMQLGRSQRSVSSTTDPWAH